MDPQGGDSNNNQPPAANATAVLDRPLGVPTEPSVAPSSNPLDRLEDVVAAAQQQVQSEKPQTEQFMSQFGSGVTPPVAEVPEQTPADKLRQRISDDIDAFLKEVLQKESVTS